MKTNSQIVALFDLDGVILDTESQYTIFWEQVGLDYLGKAGFGTLIKGQTLVNIFQNHFPDLQSQDRYGTPWKQNAGFSFQ